MNNATTTSGAGTEQKTGAARNVLAYAAQDASTALGPFSIERRELKADDVRIEILFCGVCHSDLHQARNDWGNAAYPMVPGHEIVGRVTAVGRDVTKFKEGDLAAVGCMVDSCQDCAACADGLEQYCEKGMTVTYNGKERETGAPTYGGYSEAIVTKESFVLRVPEGLDAAGAAPLLCAGITTYSPLRHWGVEAGQHVGVIGLGGLGHMGVKFAHAMGARVTVITTSPGKEEDARRLGADDVLISKDAKAMEAAGRSFDFLLNTIPVSHDANPYMGLLKLDGTMVIVGTLNPLKGELQTIPLILPRRSLAGSAIGGIAETQEMLDFCGKYGIVSDIEVINIDYINEAYGRMERSDVKYRFVIDMKSLK